MRERTRLKPSLGEEPGSGYSFHDAGRVDSIRVGRTSTPSSAGRPANDVAPRRGRSGKGPSSPPAQRAEPQRLSEPPDVGSWPPMPNVPPELEGAAESAAHARVEIKNDADDPFETMPTDPPKSATKVGGAIWEAVPSVMATHKAAADEADRIERLERAEDTERMARLTQDYADGRLARVDRLVERSAWELVGKELQSEQLTGPLALIQIIAQRELQPTDDKSAHKLTGEAIKVLAAMLQVPESSPTALLLAKRLLRRNPAFKNVPASTGFSVGVMLGGLAVGAGVGWIITTLFL